MASFNVGDRVSFPYKGNVIYATVTSVNQKSCTIRTDDGKKGRVAPVFFKLVTPSAKTGASAAADAVISQVARPKQRSAGNWSTAQTGDYELSNSSTIRPLTPGQVGQLETLLKHLATALVSGNDESIDHYSNAVSTILCGWYNCPEVKINTGGKRQSFERGNRKGETRGVHRTRDLGGDNQRSSISVFARTAKTGQYVAPRSFVRTLVHEWVHHYDRYALHIMHEFHCSGFYARMNAIYNQVKDFLP